MIRQVLDGARAMQARGDLTRIFTAAVAAADPTRLVERHLVRQGSCVSVCQGDREHARWRGTCLVVGAGKAAARMAAGCEASLGPGLVRGRVVTADGCTVPLESVTAEEAAHPLPDERGLRATKLICELVSAAGTGPVLCLISGGASSLLVQPRSPVTLGEKVEVGRLLYASGADIRDVNIVRKHLSDVKGGGLLRMVGQRPIVTLILSDVIGDPLDVIGSGPTVSDPSTFVDAWRVLERFGLESQVPETVRSLLQRGMRGEAVETLKPDEAQGQEVVNIVVGSNRTALQAAVEEAARLGYEPVLYPIPLSGDTTDTAIRWCDRIRDDLSDSRQPRRCVVAGGETTVRVGGSGRGGRNQEFALVLAERLSGSEITVLSAGTDGIDGPTDAAGAFVDGTTLQRASARGLSSRAALDVNDSYGFFRELGDLFRPGPTGTNVMDIKIAIPGA